MSKTFYQKKHCFLVSAFPQFVCCMAFWGIVWRGTFKSFIKKDNKKSMSKTFYQNRQKNLVSAFPRCFCCSTSFLPSPFVYNALRPKNKRSSNPNIAPKHALKKSIFGSGNFQRLWRWFTAFFFVQNRGIGVCPLVKSRWEALDNQTDASKRFSVPCLGLAIIPLGGFYSLFSPLQSGGIGAWPSQSGGIASKSR